MNAVLKRVRGLYISEYFIVLLLGIVIGLVAYKIFPFSGIKGLTIAVIFIFALSLLRIEWAICLFIFLSPFHYVFKEIYPSVAMDLWREVFLLCILGSWLLQVSVKKTQLPSKDILNIIIIAYILWGVLEIFLSVNLLVGIAGFRYMFSFIPLYFVVLSTIKSEREIKKYIYAILISGFIVAMIAIIQFVFVSLLGIVEPGTSIDFARKYSPRGSIRLGFQRATSVLASDNELGIFLSTCLIFVFVFNYYFPKYKAGYHKKQIFSVIMITMLIALLFSMSRSSIISFIISILAISLLRKRKKPILVAITGIIILSLFLPFLSLKGLFKPVYTFTDPYYQGMRFNPQWNTLRQSPFWGQGFWVTPTAARKLGIPQFGSTAISGTDNYFLLISSQIGIIGFLLFFLIWFLFLRRAYLGAKCVFLSENYRSISIAVFGILLGIMVVSLHTSPFESVSLASTYYVLGVIATFIHQRGKKNPMFHPVSA